MAGTPHTYPSVRVIVKIFIAACLLSMRAVRKDGLLLRPWSSH